MAQVDPEIWKQVQLLHAILQLKSLEALMLPVWLTSCAAEVSSFTSETWEKVADVYDFTSLHAQADDSFKNRKIKKEKQFCAIYFHPPTNASFPLIEDYLEFWTVSMPQLVNPP